MLLAGLSAAAQTRTVKGVVSEKTDNGSEPVIGAGVLIKGTTKGGTATNAKGEYTISVPAGQNVLVFSSIGYKDVEVEIGNRSVIDVTMETDSEMLDDVVVVGYGVQRRSDVSGSVASIKAEELALTPATNIAEMMRGKASGVQVTLGSGAPGSTSSILIRGVRSLKASTDSANEPLYVIDGIPATAAEFNAISPDDVDNLEILKDAASQAIYGSQAANGVIIINTKRGSKEKAVVTFTSSISSQHLWRNFEFYSPEEYYELRKQAVANDYKYNDPAIIDLMTANEILGDEMMEAAYAAGKSTDWESVMFSPALIQKYDVSVRGGANKFKVSASAGYLNHKGMVNIGSRFTRGNARINMDYEANRWLTIGTSSTYIKQLNVGAPSSFNSYITMTPLASAYDEDGNPLQYINSEKQKNPLYDAQFYRSETATDIARFNGYIDIHPIKGLSYKFNFGYYDRFQESSSYKTKEFTGGGAAGSISDSKLNKYTIENIVNYQVPFSNKDLSLNVTGVQGYYHQVSSGISIDANNVPIDSYWWHMIADGVNSDFGHSFSEYYTLSYLLRGQFSYKNRYMVNAAIRRDGSSRFGSGNKWGSFPSISAAWRINQEPWMKNIKEISNLKLRLSYGLVGNQAPISNYETLGTTTDYEYEFGSMYYHGYLPGNSLPNINLKWETTASANAAVDFGLWKNRFNGTIEFYNTNTYNLLFSRQINSALGYTNMTDNVAKTRTYGWDINLDGAIIRNKNVEWNAGVILSVYKNKIVRLSGEVDENGKPIDDITNKWFIGSPINVAYDYKTDGIYQYDDFDREASDPSADKWVLLPTFDSDNDGTPDKAIERTDVIAPGKIKVVDKNGDGVINADDRFIINEDPDFVASFNMGLRLWNFDFYMDWYGVHGVHKTNKYLYDSNAGGSLQGKNNGIKVNYWTPSNPSNEFPRPSFNSNTSYQSSLTMCDASYLRLRTLSAGYTFDKKFLSKIKVKTAKLTLTATNLLTFTKYLSYSPETAPGTYPEPRQYNATLTLSF